MYIIKYIFILSIFILTLYANIDEDIEAIQNAPIAERFKLMNAFKKNLIKMKNEERINAMKKLTIKSNNKHAKKALDELKSHNNKKYIEYQNIEENSINETAYQYGGDSDED